MPIICYTHIQRPSILLEENQVPSTSIPLTEDGYATLEPENVNSVNKPEEYDVTSPVNESREYDVINDEDLMKAHYEMSDKLVKNSEKSSESYDYEIKEPYLEPANEEEELMDQLSKLSLPVISAEHVE